MKRRAITTNNYHNNHPIMADSMMGYAADKNILSKIEEQFDYAEESKSKTYFMRYDVRFPKNFTHTDNGLFSAFQSAFMKNLSRQGLKPQYLAVREQSREKHQHYHVCLWLDGQKTQNISNHIKTAERLWDATLNLPPREDGYRLIDSCTKSRKGKAQINGVMLNRSAEDYAARRDECFYRASYLAKVNSKKTPQGQREIFASRIPNKK